MEFSVGFSPMGFTGKASRQIAQHSGGELPVQTTNSPQEWYNRIPPIDGEEKGGGAHDKVSTTIINYDSFFFFLSIPMSIMNCPLSIPMSIILS